MSELFSLDERYTSKYCSRSDDSSCLHFLCLRRMKFNLCVTYSKNTLKTSSVFVQSSSKKYRWINIIEIHFVVETSGNLYSKTVILRYCLYYTSDFIHTQQIKKKNCRCLTFRIHLGNHTWHFLHTMVAYYPDKPSQQQRTDIEQFFKLLGRLYPCQECARDFAQL